jgi:alkanesulfonate monooxygenase SsuD/methylene tetrahydromethanopterin reductase-like flavin-dependent oxidoreductase (luciferase family)
MSDLQFGVLCPQFELWPKAVERARLIEQLGFDSYWVADHFVSPANKQSDWFDGWSWLAGLAAETSTIRLGTLVSNIIYRNPAVLARQALSVDHISGGRLNLGIGATGSTDLSHPMTGVPVWQPSERVDRFQETIEIVDRLLRDRVTSYNGKYYQLQEAHMVPASIQQPRPPLTIAAHGPRTLRIAAKYADSWSFFNPGPDLSPAQALAVTQEKNDQLSDFAIQAGRDPESIRRSLLAGWLPENPHTSPEAFIDFVGRYQDAGINEFILLLVPDIDILSDRFLTDIAMLERFGLEALPVLRA